MIMSTVTTEIGALVVDSGAFIKAAPLEKWSERVITVREVVEEIRDANTRRRLQVLPYELVFREPTQEALHHVTMFSKKTGDYTSLSAVDMKLIALTYQLECELAPNKGANLRKEPSKSQLTAEQTSTPTKTIGFYSGPRESAGNSTKTKLGSELSATVSGDPAPQIIPNSTAEERVPAVVDLEDRIACVHISEDGETSDSAFTLENIKQVSADGECNECGSDHVVVRNGDAIESEWNRDKANEDCVNGEPEMDDGDDDDTDSDGWITPENFQQACEEMGGVTEEKANGIAVGCITTDYAMQNVMLQMGLNVISLDGMRIKKLQTYALRCKACFKITGSTSHLFCPHCGNRTLVKVSVLLDETGTTHYRHLSDKQYSHKGLRYSLPLPKGGRHAHNPLLAPDQKVTQKERRSRMNKINNPLDPDYIAQESPFAMKDVTSRGAKVASLNRKGGAKVADRRRRNPNAVQPKGRRK